MDEQIKRINQQEKKWLLKEKYSGIGTDEYHKEAGLIDEGMPVAYLIGNIEFLGCHIDLSSRALIPRAETEYWTDLLIKEYREKYSEVELRNLNVLDVFAGSGCIGIAIKKHLGCQVDFAELKPHHCEQIRKNLALNNLDDGDSSVFESDVLSSVPIKKYDLIVANPPYVPLSHKDTLVQKSVNTYEDPDAVFAGDNGNELIKRLITELKEYVKNDTEIWIEFDSSQSEDLKEFTKTKNVNIKIKSDQFDKARIIILHLNHESPR